MVGGGLSFRICRGTDLVILCVLFLQVRVLYLKTTMGKPVRIY